MESPAMISLVHLHQSTVHMYSIEGGAVNPGQLFARPPRAPLGGCEGARLAKSASRRALRSTEHTKICAGLNISKSLVFFFKMEKLLDDGRDLTLSLHR
jgi:hypothetical protein